MIHQKKTIKSLFAVLVTLIMSVALSVSMIAFAADTVTETIVVQQTITKGTVPQRTSYTYVLTPKRAENPMPAGTVDGKYTLPVLAGETSAPAFTIDIDISKPGVYEYILAKVEKTPAGDTFSPEQHIFGYKVEVDEKTGKLVSIPYICQSGSPIFSDPDENGYPTKLTLVNTIKGVPSTTAKTTSQKPASQSTTARGGTNSTISNTRARWVNTGDESQLFLWVAVIGVAVVGLFLMILLRRRHEDDDDESI